MAQKASDSESSLAILQPECPAGVDAPKGRAVIFTFEIQFDAALRSLLDRRQPGSHGLSEANRFHNGFVRQIPVTDIRETTGRRLSGILARMASSILLRLL